MARTRTRHPQFVVDSAHARQAPGDRLRNCELLVPLASGGMADVWVGRQLGDFSFERFVAVKVVRSELAGEPSVREMFLREARLTARIRHANVVRVLDLGEEGGALFQVLELVDGVSLRRLDVLRGSTPFSHAVAARILSDALRGLHAAHELVDERGEPLRLVHRDVSPHNILVDLCGVSLIADFGVAKVANAVRDEVGTRSGELKGKLGYMAPEQFLGAPLERRTDIFAVGVILWEVLTGRRLLGGPEPAASLLRLPSTRLPHPGEIVGSLRRSPLAAIAMRALAWEPSRRFTSAAEMADALERAGCASAKEVEAFVRKCGQAEVHALMTTVRAASAAMASSSAEPPRVTADRVPAPSGTRFEFAGAGDGPVRPSGVGRIVPLALTLGVALVFALAVAWSSRTNSAASSRGATADGGERSVVGPSAASSSSDSDSDSGVTFPFLVEPPPPAVSTDTTSGDPVAVAAVRSKRPPPANAEALAPRSLRPTRAAAPVHSSSPTATPPPVETEVPSFVPPRKNPYQ